MLAFFLYGPTDDRRTAAVVADTNKGVVEVQAVRLRTNIYIVIVLKSLIYPQPCSVKKLVATYVSRER